MSPNLTTGETVLEFADLICDHLSSSPQVPTFLTFGEKLLMVLVTV